MQLAKFSDYALRVVSHLAAAPGETLTTRQISDLHGIRYNHLSKVTGWLVKQGYAEATRGRGGGLRLARDPARINLGRLVRDLEADKPLVECLGPSGTCGLTSACGLAGVLANAHEAFFRTLDGYSLADTIRSEPGMQAMLTALNAAMADPA